MLSRVRLLATSWTAAYQVPPSMGFSRQEYWSGVPLPSPMSVPEYTYNLCLSLELFASFNSSNFYLILIVSTLHLLKLPLKRLPAMRETWFRSLGREDPLEKEMATHSSILAWRIPWTEEPGGLQSTGLQRVGHD